MHVFTLFAFSLLPITLCKRVIFYDSSISNTSIVNHTTHYYDSKALYNHQLELRNDYKKNETVNNLSPETVITYKDKTGSFNLTREMYDGLVSYMYSDKHDFKCFEEYNSLIIASGTGELKSDVTINTNSFVINCNHAVSSSPSCKATCGARKCNSISSSHNCVNSGNGLFICGRGTNPDLPQDCECITKKSQMRKGYEGGQCCAFAA